MLKGAAALMGRGDLMIDALLSKDKSFCPIRTVPNIEPNDVTGLSLS